MRGENTIHFVVFHQQYPVLQPSTISEEGIGKNQISNCSCMDFESNILRTETAFEYIGRNDQQGNQSFFSHPAYFQDFLESNYHLFKRLDNFVTGRKQSQLRIKQKKNWCSSNSFNPKD